MSANQNAPELTSTNKNMITVKKANINSVDDLVLLTGNCFPDHIIWGVRSLSEKYWKGVLDSNSTETWIWYIDEFPAAFSQIITDIGSWSEEKTSYQYGLITKLISLVTHPKIFQLKISKALNNKRDNAIYVPGKVTDLNIRANEFLKTMTDFSSPETLVKYGGLIIDPEKTLWVERAGILPSFRKHGLALIMLRFSDSRAKDLDRTAIFGKIESRNTAWCFLHERFGYASIFSGNNSHTFMKFRQI